MRLCDDGTSVDDWGEPSPRVSFLALPRTHARGHHLSLTGGSFPAVQEQDRTADRTSRPTVAIRAVYGVTVGESSNHPHTE